MWKKICCPVDFSRESQVALEDAAELASRVCGALTLVHVSDRAPSPSETLAGPGALALRAIELDRTLGRWKEAAERIAGAPVGVALLSGDPAVEIVRFARENGHDVVVMGTRGETDLAHLRLGSVAQAVVREATCTVVVVRRRAPVTA